MTKDQLEAAAREALRDVLDPETGLSLVDLGLIYEVTFAPEDGHLEVLMTFTTPACPAGELMSQGVQRRLGSLPGVTWVEVQVTFDPRWTPDRISAEGRAQLGW